MLADDAGSPHSLTMREEERSAGAAGGARASRRICICVTSSAPAVPVGGRFSSSADTGDTTRPGYGAADRGAKLPHACWEFHTSESPKRWFRADNTRGDLGTIALVFIVVAIIYVPGSAKSLPSFVPGHIADSTGHHPLRAAGSLIVIGIVFAVGAWFRLAYKPRPQPAAKNNKESSAAGRS